MKIYKRVVVDMQTGLVESEDAFEYSGPLALCTGGEEAAAASQGAKATGEAAAAGSGAAAGTLATANAVGAAGGDALGSFIAGNAANWGVDVAAGVGGAGTALSMAKDAATVLGPISSIYSASQAVSASKMMRSTGTPTVPSLAEMPILGGPQYTQRMQASFADQLNRRGRASTILTAPTGEKLGQ